MKGPPLWRKKSLALRTAKIAPLTEQLNTPPTL